MKELSPERQALLGRVVDIQERELNAVIEVFSGLRGSSDPEVVSICDEVLKSLKHNADLIDAMVEALNHTKH